MEVNPNDPLSIAADCFKDTLMDVGTDPTTAESARVAFLSLKKDRVDELQDQIIRIASKVRLDA